MDKDSNFYRRLRREIEIENIYWRWSTERLKSAITIVSLNSNKGGHWWTVVDTARPKVQSSPALWFCQLFSTVNEYNRWAGLDWSPLQISTNLGSQPTNQQTLFADFLTFCKYKNSNVPSIKVNCHLAFVSVF